MRALKLTALSGVTIVCLALLAGCGGDSDSDDETPAPDPTASAEETILGVDLLPPDSVITAAADLTAEDMPPGDTNAAATPGEEDRPPA